MTRNEQETYRRLRRLGWSESEARGRAAVIAAAAAGGCECQHVKHLPGDDRCPTFRPATTDR